MLGVTVTPSLEKILIDKGRRRVLLKPLIVYVISYYHRRNGRYVNFRPIRNLIKSILGWSGEYGYPYAITSLSRDVHKSVILDEIRASSLMIHNQLHDIYG